MKLYFSSLLLLCASLIYAQDTLKGTIKDKHLPEENQGVMGANVYWLNTETGSITDEKGAFTIPYKPSYKKLVISYVGYYTDTLDISEPTPIEHYLTDIHTLDEVELKTRKTHVQKSFFSSANIQTVGSGELLRSACCNLSESFETNPSIDVNMTDAITGKKQIQMLGLTSPYISITQENVPSIRGAAQSYGLTFTPGTWVESIQISKGAGSVVNGYESISGQINTELVKPKTDKKLFVNLYGALGGRLEGNVHLNQKVSDKWHTGLYIHGNNRSLKKDSNHDNFLDMPVGNQINIMNRWQYENHEKGWVSFINLRYLDDRKQMGELQFDPSTHKYSTQYWGSEVNTKRFETALKLGYTFPDNHYKSIGFQTNYSHHRQLSYFGVNDYNITHQSYYLTAIYNSIISNEYHKFKTGLNFFNDDYKELWHTNQENLHETGIGAFFEYAYDNHDNFSVNIGLRADTNNHLGNFITPRLHLRYAPWALGVLRASAGRGKKAAHVFAENQQLFASSRVITVMNQSGSINDLEPETAWNYGLSFLQGYKLFTHNGDLTLDFYRTHFDNQVVVDWENPQAISFYNLEGESVANSFQAELNQHLFYGIGLRLAYKYFDVFTDYRSGRNSKPLQPKHRWFANLSFETSKKDNSAQWKFDATLNHIGKQRLPGSATLTQPFSTLSGQITKVFSKQFEVYAGGENLTNVSQANPILGSDNPFGPNFDSTLIYAPVFGANYYFGLRYKID